MRKAVILDKDGVVNFLIERDNGEITSPYSMKELRVYPRVKKAIRKLKDMGYLVLMVTNQPWVGSRMTTVDMEEMVTYIENELGVDEVQYSTVKGSYMYKPNDGLFRHFIIKYGIDCPNSYMIGDRWKDIIPAQKNRIQTIFVGEPRAYKPPPEYVDIIPDFMASDLFGAVQLIEWRNTTCLS